MKLAPPTRHSTRAQAPTPRGEVALRYGAAYACTLVSIAGAQLIVANSFVLAMAILTILGLPVSLFWRATKLRVFGVRIPRFGLNSAVVLISGVAGLYVLNTQAHWFSRDLYQNFMLRGMTETFSLAVEMVLLFAAFRSFAIISDKDAVLCAISSFSVLLFLIVIHRGPAVVAYFLAWAIFSAILFTLDHRADLRHNLNGVVPSLVPHQDVKLSSRGLFTVMSFSLACAFGISWYLSSRDPNERGVVENWILGLAGRMTQVALAMPDVSVNSGPERQIDYSSGPALPTRQELWDVAAITQQNQFTRPRYWRMFTLSVYDGATWSQTSGSGFGVPKQMLTAHQWVPHRFQFNGQPSGGNERAPSGAHFSFRVDGGRRNRNLGGQNFGRRNRDEPSSSASASTPSAKPNATQATAQSDAQRTADFIAHWRRPGYDIFGHHPRSAQMLRAFGAPRNLTYQFLTSRVANVGYIPNLPALRGLRLMDVDFDKLPATVRVRQDGALDTGVLSPGQRAMVLSEASPDPAYGELDARRAPPLLQKKPQRAVSLKLSDAPVLSPNERAINLKLPPRLQQKDSPILKFAREVLRQSKPNETNFKKAQRLAWAIQQGAVYTLRPPQIPDGADAAEYFLFTSRRGYCTYFAGALTVLCRAAGIPARVVSGFANPEWSRDEHGLARGVLREANAHAWTEVWIEGWGWAVVDATPASDRGDNAPDWWENWSDLFASVFDNTKRWSAAHPLLLLVFCLLAGIGVLFAAARRGLIDPIFARLHSWTKGRVQLSEDQSRRLIFHAYQRMAKKLARKFRPRIVWETPHEYLTAAEAALDLQNAASLRELTRLYERAQYSPRDIDNRDGASAYHALKNLSWKTRRETP